MFRGRYEHSIDAKGRTSLPSRFRDGLMQAEENRLVITAGLESCAVAYPFQEWLAFEQRLASLPRFDSSVTMLRRIIVSSAVDCEIDKLGRVIIPANLRLHAELDKEVVWLGMGPHIELWSKTLFDDFQKEVFDSAERRQEMAKRLSELGL